MVTPTHLLASARSRFKPEAISSYRAVAAADSSRHLPLRTAGLLDGQGILTVSDIQQ